MAHVVAVLHALVTADDVEQAVPHEEVGGDVGTEHAGEAAGVGKVAVLLLK